METELIQSHGMDLSKVSVVRSAKGVDMLCVDNYLYHFDRIGKNNSYRWLCNRRKDKHTPCKSRICTLLPNPMDKGRHIVMDVVLAHCHERCSDHEIQKVIKRKRLSLMKMNDAYSATQPKRARVYERATAGLTGPEWISAEGEISSIKNSSFHLDFEEKDRVYMLRRRDGRVMVCIDGHLYYLSGKSYMGDMCIWTCVRNRDIKCAAKICTEVTLAGAHRLHPFEESDVHLHPHYSANKLMHMFEKHQIVLVEDEQTNDVLLECQNMEYFDPAVIFDQQQQQNHHHHQQEVQQTENEEVNNQRVADDLESIIIEDCEETYEDYVDNEDEDLDNVDVGEVVVEQEENVDEEEFQALEEKWPPASKVIENYMPPEDYNPMTETNLRKFIFLPSAKGRKVLCINRYLYHFDAQSRSNGHMFFTCVMRRDKQKTCHVRVTLDPQPNGPVVLRINGEHTHKPDVTEILGRLKRMDRLKTDYGGSLQCKSDPDDTPVHINEYQDQDYNQDENPAQEVQNVVMKKVINMDGSIKIEADSSKSNLIVEYMKDTSDNISAKIEISPHALKEKASPPPPQITNVRRRRDNAPAPNPNSELFPDMDLTKIWTVRSAKGAEMLCVDGYIYHAKNRGLISRNYWVCIKSRDSQVNCKSRISTATQKDGSIRVLRVYNTHSHAISENDIKRRYFNEINKKSNKQIKFRPLHFMGKSLDEIKQEYGDLSIERLNVSNINPDILVKKEPRVSGGMTSSSVSSMCRQEQTLEDYVANVADGSEHLLQEEDEGSATMEGQEEDEFEDELHMMDHYMNMEDATDSIIEVVEEAATDEMENYGTIVPIYTMKLYAVSDGPPSLAVRMTLKALDIQYQLINVDFCALEHRTEEYAKMNPQKEIPVLDDNGFYLSESIAIMQYLCDKYAPDSTLYPQDVNQRALINQRLCFNMGFYYLPISSHSMAPIFFDYERTPMSLKRVENALDVFETYLERLGTKYAAGENVTIADFALISATLCLEAIDFDLAPYPLVQRWYLTFKDEFPQLWEIANGGMQEINAFEHNPPDLSQMNHPFHPTRKQPKA